MGVVKKAILKSFGIKQEVLFADIAIQKLYDKIADNQVIIQELHKYPSVKRDLALLVDQKVSFSELYQTAYQTEPKFLKEVTLFDVYEVENLPEGKKSYALSFVLRDKNKTLNEKQIDKTMQKLTQSFEKQFNAELRS